MSDEEVVLHMQHTDLSVVKLKIQQLVQSIGESSSKKELKQELCKLVQSYYECNPEIATYLSQLFPPPELIEFLEASQMPRPLVIRTNTLKTKRRELAQKLIQKGVNLDPVAEWSKVGLKIIESQVPIGATPEYLAGHYIRQAANSFLPVMALAPRPGEKVLDLCAAPGGKTTHIGQLMKNKGIIVANELNKDRTRSIRGNVHRMGLTNVVISCFDGRLIHSHFNCFDRALVDAPCSGLGIIWKDPSVKMQRSLKDIRKNAHIQKELLLAAIDSVNSRSVTGGFIVYSTCSVTVEENEGVVQHALKNRSVKVIETGLPLGDNGFTKYRGKKFHDNMSRCKRVYPHSYNMEGFFIAKLKKFSNELPEGASRPRNAEKREKNRKHSEEERDVEEDEEEPEEQEEEEVREEVLVKKKPSKYFQEVPQTQELPVKREKRKHNKPGKKHKVK